MMRSYLVKWDGGQRILAGLHAAIQLADENNGRIFIAEGKFTKSLDGIKIYQFDDEDED